ncbi:MAG TPA: hypothetical protein ENI81_07890 [Phycisphaerales bacterium]|nr:hypothetical protein [Phycisphaerales bacterium]
MLPPEINWNPSRKELRTFAIIALIAAVLVSLLLYLFRGLGLQWAAMISSIGAAIFLTGFVSLKATRVIYLGLSLVTLPIGLVISFLLLATFYFGILTPLAVVFRLIGRDALNRRFDADADSYWVTHRQGDDLDRYFNQF